MITDAMASQFKADILDGVHESGDVYRLALIKPSSAATYDADYDAYSAGMDGDEVETGGGYVQGGAVLSGRATGISAGAAYLEFDDVTWPDATITAAGAVIYNASKSNKVLGVFQLRNGGGTPADISSTNGDFTIQIPQAGTGILRIS